MTTLAVDFTEEQKERFTFSYVDFTEEQAELFTETFLKITKEEIQACLEEEQQ